MRSDSVRFIYSRKQINFKLKKNVTCVLFNDNNIILKICNLHNRDNYSDNEFFLLTFLDIFLFINFSAFCIHDISLIWDVKDYRHIEYNKTLLHKVNKV